MLHENANHESEATVIEDVCRPTAAGRSARRTLLALLVLGGVGLLTFSYQPAVAATTFTVTETGDAGDINLANARCDTSSDTGDQCTLRAALEEANDTPGADTIDFDIGSGTAARTISPSFALPIITDTVTIDGYTQAGASPNTLEEGNDAVLKVQLDGSGAGFGAIGLRSEAPDCTITGLVIRNFGGPGILIAGSRGTNNSIEGNFIGTSRDGTSARGNSVGVYVAGASNTVGGTQPEMRNVISGNDGSGVNIYEPAATANRVEGNYVGTTADGTGDLGNDENGLYVYHAAGNTIGGTASGAGNVISGNGERGIYMLGNGVTDTTIENSVEGNYVGTTADGTEPLGNSEDGVFLYDASENTIGGTAAGARNVISANEENGIYIYGAKSTGNKVEGNYIGSTTDGNSDLGNAMSGVFIQNADSTVIGGTLSGAPNRIAHNDGDGVSVTNDNSGGNLVFSNRIYRNAGLGIDLDDDGVSSNDTDDPDAGPNGLQNFPTIRSAVRSFMTGETTISGRLNSNPSQLFEVQCFLTNGASATAHGEGRRLLATDIVQTNSSGNGTVSCVSDSANLGQVPGQTVSATATNLITFDTSEFSNNEAITTGP